jgi:thiamine-phosphate pyrophosphorylase
MRPSFDLIVISDARPELVERVDALREALSPRVALLLRDKLAGAGALLDQALRLRAITRAHGASLLISDRVDIALAASADGVQLPEAGLPVATARALLGPQALVGVSRHDLAGLRDAERAGANYATLAPIYASPGKGAPVGCDTLRRAARHTGLPLFALGGVRAENVSELVQAGAAGVAAIREVFDAAQPERAILALLRALTAARSS